MGIEEQILEMREQRGIKKGQQERNSIIVENLLRSTDFSDEKIASLAAVPVSFIEEIRSKISQ